MSSQYLSSQCDLSGSDVSSQGVSFFYRRLGFSYKDGIGVVTHEENSLKDHSKVSHGVHNLQDLGAAATYSVSVVD
jgi:hypothetical protein